MNWKAVRQFFIDWFAQSFIAVDQAVNAVFTPLFTLRVGWADETLSARTYRAAKRGKIVGRALQPIINALFFWQGPDHCRNAYMKEQQRANLPPEYR